MISDLLEISPISLYMTDNGQVESEIMDAIQNLIWHRIMFINEISARRFINPNIPILDCQ